MDCPLCKGNGNVPDGDKMNLASRVIAVRIAKDWTQAQLAEKLDKTVRMISAYENGDVLTMQQITFKRFRRIERSI